MGQKSFAQIINVPLEEAGRETSFDLPAGTSAVTLKTRFNNDVKMAYEANQLDKAFLTIPGNSSKNLTDLNLQSKLSIFVSCDADDEVLEVECWK